MSAPTATQLRPTKHAKRVMADRRVPWTEVVDTVRYADNHYRSRGDHVFQRNQLAVVVSKDGAVITVLLRAAPGGPRWTNQDARNRDRRAA
jgi:hypothetical protein